MKLAENIGNQIAGAIANAKLYAERKQMEETLRQSEERFRRLFDEAPIGYQEIDTEGRITRVNKTQMEMLGYSAEEMVDKLAWDFMKDSDIVQKAFKEKIKGMIPPGRAFERAFQRKDGTTVHVLAEDRYLMGNDDQVTALCTTFLDVTERRQAERRLQESEVKFRQLYDEAPIGYHEFDIEGRITQVNRTELEMLGYAAEEMLGQPVWKFVVGEEISRQAVLSKLSGAKPPSQAFERSFRRKDGTAVPVLIHERILRDSAGKIIGIRSTQQDITERKVLESQLVQAQKLEAIGQLAAGIAHEINTPIQYVGDNTRFLMDAFKDMTGLFEKYGQFVDAVRAGSASEDNIQEVENRKKEIDLPYLIEDIPRAIQQTLEGVNRVAEIVRAMKEFSHPGPKEKTPTNLNRAIGNTITVARNEWKYVAEMVTDFDPNLPPVPCLLNEFNQVILNLIINAVHAIKGKVGDGSSEKRYPHRHDATHRRSGGDSGERHGNGNPFIYSF